MGSDADVGARRGPSRGGFPTVVARRFDAKITSPSGHISRDKNSRCRVTLIFFRLSHLLVFRVELFAGERMVNDLLAQQYKCECVILTLWPDGPSTERYHVENGLTRRAT